MKQRPPGTFSESVKALDKMPVELNKRYRVVRGFTDIDGHQHDVGDEFTLLAVWFNKFDDEVVLGISKGDGSEWALGLSWDNKEQKLVIEGIATYLANI